MHYLPYSITYFCILLKVCIDKLQICLYHLLLDAFNTRGSNSSLNPPKSCSVISTGNSPRQSPTPVPGTVSPLHNHTSVSIASSSLPGGEMKLKYKNTSNNIRGI